MPRRLHLLVLVCVLTALGLGLAVYRHVSLGVPFSAGKMRASWLVEAAIYFEAEGKPVKISLGLPEEIPPGVVWGESTASSGFGFDTVTAPDGPRAEWTARELDGGQRLFYQLRLADAGPLQRPARIRGEAAPVPEAPRALDPDLRRAAEDLVAQARASSSDELSLTRQMLKLFGPATATPEAGIILREFGNDANARVKCLIDMLARAGTAARPVRGLRLNEAQASQQPLTLFEVAAGDHWELFHPDGTAVPGDFLPWLRGKRALLDVEGGQRSTLRFSALREYRPAELWQQSRVDPLRLPNLDMLPLGERSAFRYLLLVPLGAMVVVFFRNFLGMPTLGTFMPVLLALALLEMPLLQGLIVFAVVIAAGLYIRFLFSQLHLLVVSRVAAVIVLVVLIMIGMALVSQRLGFDTGMQVTLFPMVVLSWTIERLSLQWDEEGSQAALRQLFGSSLVAVAAYAVMTLDGVRHLLFHFPELLLVVLALILLSGRYTGYRLSELVRFRSLADAAPLAAAGSAAPAEAVEPALENPREEEGR